MPGLRPVTPELADVDRLVYRSDIVAIGAFRCPASHPLFQDSGPIRDHCVVFPRTATRIRHENRAAFLADPTMVTLYASGQTYRRAAVSPEGDRCDYIALAPGVLEEAASSRGTPTGRRGAATFGASHVAGPAPLYLRQRELFRHVSSGAGGDADAAVDEAALLIVDAVLDLVEGAPGGAGAATVGGGRSFVGIADVARQLVALHLARPLPLSAIARAVRCSPFHLCRVFRRATGMTLHQYRHELRLREALSLLDAGADLSAAALLLGYSSHSHFTAAFRRRFGVTPSAARARGGIDRAVSGRAVRRRD